MNLFIDRDVQLGRGGGEVESEPLEAFVGSPSGHHQRGQVTFDRIVCWGNVLRSNEEIDTPPGGDGR